MWVDLGNSEGALRFERAELRADHFGDGRGRKGRRVDAGDAHGPGGDDLAAQKDCLREDAGRAAQTFDGGLDREIVFKLRGAAVFDREIRHDEEHAAHFRIHALRDPEAPQNLRAGALHEFEVVRVIDDAARVGVFPVDADGIAEGRHEL